MKASDRERPDWTIVVITILVIGFLCVIVAGQLAVRFSPRWQLDANMESRIDPNSTFVASRPSGFIQPVDAAILTQPGWIDDLLTPGITLLTPTPFTTLHATTSTSSPAATTVSSATTTPMIVNSPTNTFVFIPWTPTSTRRPKPTKTQTPVTITSDTPTFVVVTATQTSTATATATSTPTITRTPAVIPTDPTPPEINGAGVYTLSSGSSLTLGITLVANGDSNFDLVYYELSGGSGILLDWIVIEISNGYNWYTIFNWGDNIADANTNMNFNILPNPQTPPEPDQRNIPSSALYNSTGIAIDIDAIVPAGTYSYIRFWAPPGDLDGYTEIDAIEILP